MNLIARIDFFHKLQFCWQTKKQKQVLELFWNNLSNAILHLKF